MILMSTNSRFNSPQVDSMALNHLGYQSNIIVSLYILYPQLQRQRGGAHYESSMARHLSLVCENIAMNRCVQLTSFMFIIVEVTAPSISSAIISTLNTLNFDLHLFKEKL